MKMKKPTEAYWTNRAKQIEQAANNLSVKQIKDAEKKYEQAMHEIDAKINKWYQRIADNNNLVSMDEARRFLSKAELKEFKWDVQEYIKFGEQNAVDQAWMKELENASAKFHISRLEAMKMDCRQSMEEIFAGGQQNMFNTLRDVYTDSYYHTMFDVQKGIGVGFDVGRIDDKQLQKLINRPWAIDGKNFSERLWANKSQLVNQLDQHLTRMVLTGQSPDKAIRDIQKVMQTSKNNAARLVLTEQAFFTTQAQKDAYKELDVEEFEFVATLDEVTCEICQPLDGTHYPLKDQVVGVNAPPMHPFCRCTTVPFFDDEFTNGERWSREEHTEPIPEKMTYKEWSRKYLKHSSSSDDRIDWLPKGEVISKEVREELHAYASKHGVTLEGIRKSDVNPELIKEVIDDVDNIRIKYPNVYPDNIILKFSPMHSSDFAETYPNKSGLIVLNQDAFRNKEKLAFEYNKLVESGHFPQGTDYHSIIHHEMGHIFADVNNIDIMKGAKEVLDVDTEKLVFYKMQTMLSKYAGKNEEELFAEVFSSINSKKPVDIALKLAKKYGMF